MRTPKQYIHDLRGPIQPISGSYELEKEGIMEVDGKQVLYVVGNAVVDSSCCGVGGCRYALVPGYIRNLKVRQNGEGLWVSEAEPIMDGTTRQKITRLLEEKELVQQVQFV